MILFTLFISAIASFSIFLLGYTFLGFWGEVDLIDFLKDFLGGTIILFFGLLILNYIGLILSSML